MTISKPTKSVLPGDAFFLIRPSSMEAQAMRIAAMPLAERYGGKVADEFHLTVQRARHVPPEAWGTLLATMQQALQGCKPFRLEAVGLWCYHSQFLRGRALFWTMRLAEPLGEIRKVLDQELGAVGGILSPFSLPEWKPHTLALHNVEGEDGDLPLPAEFPKPSFTVQSLWLSIYQPWGDFAEHPIVIFNPGTDEER